MDSSKPQLRYKITSDEWVVIAPARSSTKKPNEFKHRKEPRVVSPKSSCPFEEPQKKGNKDPYFWYPKNKPLSGWFLQVLENKYPALEHDKKHRGILRGKKVIDSVMDGVGYHDLLITRLHTKNFPRLSPKEAAAVFEAFAERYMQIDRDVCIKYISIFHNWGADAGASVYHPHYQIISLPFVPKDVGASLHASKRFWQKNKTCLHCAIIKQEKKDKSRIVYEDKNIIAFVPFASKEPFGVNIFPKKHEAYFEKSSVVMRGAVANGLQHVLKLIKKRLGDPDYNFFIHTAPAYQKRSHSHYHWHVEIVPKSNISAGFELGTGVEINPVLPEQAATILRGK